MTFQSELPQKWQVFSAVGLTIFRLVLLKSNFPVFHEIVYNMFKIRQGKIAE